MRRFCVSSDQGAVSGTLPELATVAELQLCVAKEYGTAPEAVTLILDGEFLGDPTQAVGALPCLDLQAIVSGPTTRPKPQESRLKELLPRIAANDPSLGEHLDLRGWSLGDAEARALAEALLLLRADTPRGVTSLFLADNSIGDEGAHALARVIAAHSGPRGLHLVSLDRNAVGDAGFEALADALRSNTSVNHLSLESNRATQRGGRALAAALESNHSLTYLVVGGEAARCPELRRRIADGYGVRANVALRQSLHVAVSRGDARAVESALAMGVDATSLTDPENESVVHLAVRAGSPPVLKTLLASPACRRLVDCRDGSGNTPLHVACALGQTPAISMLLEHGADPCAVDGRGRLAQELSAPGKSAISSWLRGRVASCMLSGDVAGLSDALVTFYGLCPTEPPMAFLGSYHANVRQAVMARRTAAQRLPPSIASALKQTELSKAVSRLEAILADPQHPAQLRSLAGVLEALCLQKLKHDDGDARRLFQAHRHECSECAPIFLWDMRTARDATAACGAAVAYLMACAEYPPEWRAEASSVLKQHAAAAINCGRPAEAGPAPRPAAASLDQRWNDLRDQRPAAETASLGKLLALVGLAAVKDRMVTLFEELGVRRDQGRGFSGLNLHARFEGNPGTGKSTVVGLYGEILKECGLFGAGATVAVERTTGSKLLDAGPAKLKDLLDKIATGVVFVDEAYQLDPVNNLTGRQVLELLMDEMEERRGKLVVVIAGYSKQIEKLVEFNPGLPSRFPQRFVFDDYSDDELHAMLRDMVDAAGFHTDDPRWCRVAAQRLGRSRGRDGFGNARDVRNLFETAILKRQSVRIVEERRRGANPDVRHLTRDDLLGPKADRATLLEHCSAYHELREMVGLREVKRTIEQMVDVAVRNAELEERGEPLIELNLNRVFLGNPGTGKTTVAKLYAAILRHLGLLTVGEVIYKTASDFNGTVLGEATKVTVGILEAARGSVLVIDEAYALDPTAGSPLHGAAGGDPYKRDVINALVERVQGKPGDDIAVVLLGYRDEMEKMLRNSNAGLARRFNLDSALLFTDYDDDALWRILQDAARKAGLTIGVKACLEAVTALARQRALPRFGNAGAAHNLLSSAKLRMQERLQATSTAAEQKELLPEDFATSLHQQQQTPPTDEELGPDLARVRSEIAVKVAKSEASGRSVADELEYGYLFVGPPGTGKTTAARLVGRMLHALGLLAEPAVVEKHARDFVTGYAQQAGKQTEALFQEALGKVLFIDEAYSLLSEDPRGEVMNTICALMTAEQYKGKLSVILAGYDDEMASLLASNPGLPSRFPQRVRFRAWDTAKSSRVLVDYLTEREMTLDDAAASALPDLLRELGHAPGWSSGRDVLAWGRALYGKVELGSPVTLAHLRATMRDLIATKQNVTEPRARRLAAYLPSAEDALLPICAAATRASAAALDDDNEKKLPPLLPDDDPWQPLRALGIIDLDSLDPSDPAIMRSLLQQGLDAAAARQLLERWEHYVKELARLAEEQRLREEEEERRRQELEQAARQAAEEEERQRLAEEARRIRAEQARQQAIQTQLARIGNCPMGYAWIRQGGGWRCAGGSHYVSNGQLNT